MATTEYLLTSEDFIKEVTNISDNLSGKYLQGAIREAQEVVLRGIIGSCLLDHCKQLFASEQLEGYYKELVDRCQYFLAYTVLADLPMKASYKVTNFGLAKSNDENLSVATMDEIVANQGYYQAKADARCYELQTWLLQNKGLFPELDDCACSRMHANLTSAASCGIYLGGARGKARRSTCKCSKK